MATLINTSYFERDLLLQVEGLSEFESANVQCHIEQYEPEYLVKVLGVSLYDVFMAAITLVPDFDPSDFNAIDFATGSFQGIETRWGWLLYGHTYTINGQGYRWPGFITSTFQSPIAAYVYWMYRENTTTTTNSTGETLAKNENSSIVSPGPKMVKAWNKMIELNNMLRHILIYAVDGDNVALYPELVRCEADWEMFHRTNTFGI